MPSRSSDGGMSVHSETATLVVFSGPKVLLNFLCLKLKFLCNYITFFVLEFSTFSSVRQ